MLTIDEIKSAVNKIAINYPIRQVNLFGSYAEGCAKPESDIDILVEFMDRPITLLDYCGFQQELSEALKIEVDLLKSPISDVTKTYLQIDKVVRLYG